MRLPPEALTRGEVDALLGVCGRSPSGVRNRALILTLYRAGLRLGDALALLPRDLGDGFLTVRHSKGDKHRIVAVPSDLEDALGRWLLERDRLGATGRHPVFCAFSKGCVGRPLHQAYVRELLPRLARRAGIEKRVHAHGLRHSHALALARSGVDLVDIRDQLGHANVSVTDAYLRRVAPEARLARVRTALEGASTSAPQQ